MSHEAAGNEVYFYDTYALFGLVRASPNYAALKDARLATSYMNLYELYYMMCQGGERELAAAVFQECLAGAFQPEPETIKLAAEFRLKHTKRKLSYIDCLGYALAQELRLPFLTGDEGFRGLPNVKFVKE
ncbi:MAG: PIN domain-containing protein [Nanoarchaeota archaeon]